MRLGSVPEFDDERMVFERPLHDGTLHALAASVNESNLGEARCVRCVDVLLDDRRDVARRERVKIERLFDRNLSWLRSVVGEFGHGAPELPVGRCYTGYVAVTTVFMPPRTAKSPTTRMRRGWHAATRSSRI